MKISQRKEELEQFSIKVFMRIKVMRIKLKMPRKSKSNGKKQKMKMSLQNQKQISYCLKATIKRN